VTRNSNNTAPAFGPLAFGMQMAVTWPRKSRAQAGVNSRWTTGTCRCTDHRPLPSPSSCLYLSAATHAY